MKKFILLTAFVFSVFRVSSQPFQSEKVNWESLKSYHADQITFQSDEITMQCMDCNFIVIETASGITGIFLLGSGSVEIQEGNISDKISGCMIRFNPADMDTFLAIKGKTTIQNKGFVALSKNILNDSFNHCYHSGSDALIPEKGHYALNMFSNTHGEILASFAGEKKVVYNFSEKTYLVE